MLIINPRPVHVRICADENKRHARDPRGYAHVNHYVNTICVADAIYDLPPEFRYGIILHELGHLKLMPQKHSELDADIVGGKLARVIILRDSHGKARNLERVRAKDISRARAYISRYTDFRVRA